MGIQALIDSAIAAVTEAATAATTATSAALTTAATDVGIGAETAGAIGSIGGPIATHALEGAALGAITDPSNPLKGAESGAITGGALGAAGPLASGLGIGMTAADVLAGAGGGALGALATGGKPLQGALQGAVAGGIASQMPGGDVATKGTADMPAPVAKELGGIASAPGTAAPPSVAASPDVTQQFSGTSVGGGLTGAAPQATALTAPQETGAQFATPGGTSPLTTAAQLQDALTPGTQPYVPPRPGVANETVTAYGTRNLGAPSASTALASPTSSLVSTLTPGAVGAGAASGQDTKAGPNVSDVSAASQPASQVSDKEAAAAKGGWGDILSNPSALLTAAGMGSQVMRGNRMPQEFGALSGIAARDLAQGQRLEGYMATGTLPPGMQAGLTSATTSAEAAIRQQYANLGMSGSTAETIDIQNTRIAAAAKANDLAMQLYTSGVSQTEMGQKIYSDLMNTRIQQDKEFADSFANFGRAMASMGRPWDWTQSQTAAG